MRGKIGHKRIKLIATGMIIAGMLIFVQACTNSDDKITNTKKEVNVSEINKAVCILHPIKESNVKGTVTLPENA